MKKVLKLSKEQARTLYNLLSAAKDVNRSDNRKRWKFLEVIEDTVFKFDDTIAVLSGSVNEADLSDRSRLLRKVNEEIKEVGKQSAEYVFNDREAFAKVKDIFEKAGDNLIGRDSKIYVEIEDAFADVKEVKDPQG